MTEDVSIASRVCCAKEFQPDYQAAAGPGER